MDDCKFFTFWMDLQIYKANSRLLFRLSVYESLCMAISVNESLFIQTRTRSQTSDGVSVTYLFLEDPLVLT